MLLASDCGDDAQLRDLVERLIDRVRSVGARAYGGRFPVGMGIGITTLPDRMQDVDESSMALMQRCAWPYRPLDLCFPLII